MAVLGRRDFLFALGGTTVAWPRAAHAQQPATPVIGFLSPGSPESDGVRLTGVRQGLKESGYVEGQNVGIEYRFAHGQNDRLPALAADLVGRRVAGMVTAGTPATLAARTATTTIPIVFYIAVDPVQFGLAASLSAPAATSRAWGRCRSIWRQRSSRFYMNCCPMQPSSQCWSIRLTRFPSPNRERH
jgi:putative tryptophan/tyrosine transport system substrate-binding protein